MAALLLRHRTRIECAAQLGGSLLLRVHRSRVLHGALCVAARTRRTHQGVQVVLTEGHELIENMKEDNQKLIGILRLKDSEKKALLAQMQEQAPSTHHHNACARAHLAGQTR
jgi:hypothetical protein